VVRPRPFTVFLDASVLYPAPLRDILLELAVSDFFRAKWSAKVHDEWTKAVLRNRPDLDHARLVRTRNLMDTHVRDALVTGYEPLIEGLHLPDPHDRHILAAAIVSRADMILTWNMKHFPKDLLEPWGMEAQDPDSFLVHQLHLEPEAFVSALRRVRKRLCKPSKTASEYLDILRKQRLAETVAAIEAYQELI